MLMHVHPPGIPGTAPIKTGWIFFQSSADPMGGPNPGFRFLANMQLIEIIWINPCCTWISVLSIRLKR